MRTRFANRWSPRRPAANFTATRFRDSLVYLALICILVVPVAAIRAQDQSDLLLKNGRIYTVNADHPWAEAVLIRDGKFAAVGSNAEVAAAASNKAQVIDLQGRFALPGFIDTHIHFASAARFHEFNLMTCTSQDEFVRRVKELVAILPSGEWITGGLWGAYDQWQIGSASSTAREENFAPDMALIEPITKEHPVFIRRFDNGEFAANRLALQLAGIDFDDSDSSGAIEFLRDANDVFHGRMRGAGVQRAFRKVIPAELSSERRVSQTKNALRLIARHGVTTVSDMSDDAQLLIYRNLHQRGELTTRIDFRYTLDRWEELAADGIRVGSGDEWIRLGGLKGFIDGIMGTSSARFFEPYDHQPNNRGQWREMMKNEQGQVDPQHFFGFMHGADRAGLQITVHAIGDEANHLLLDFVQQLNDENGQRDRRLRLVHAQVVGEDDFRRIGELGIIAEVQPFHLSDDMRWMEERIGRDRCRNAYAFRKIQEGGARLCFGSDWPGTSAAEYPINPLLALYAAVTRQTIRGTPDDGWFPDQRFDLQSAIRAHTLDAAYALFEENAKGSIEQGKLADIVVLSNNLFEIAPTQFLTTECLLTIVGGRIVHQSDQQ